MSLLGCLFPTVLPCIKAGAVRADETPRCLKEANDGGVIKNLRCPMCDKLETELKSFQTQAYKGGYDYVAWVVTEGPNCELVTFATEPTEQELQDRYGKDLIAVVPL
jgi:hypothetical protein